MITAYDLFKAMLHKVRCSKCEGMGEIDDLEPGDICGNTQVCPTCKGLGLDIKNFDGLDTMMENTPDISGELPSQHELQQMLNKVKAI